MIWERKKISENGTEGTSGPLLPGNSQYPILLQHVDKLDPNPSPQVWNGGCYVTHGYPTELAVEVELAFLPPFHHANLKKFLQFKFQQSWCSDKAFLLSCKNFQRKLLEILEVMFKISWPMWHESDPSPNVIQQSHCQVRGVTLIYLPQTKQQPALQALFTNCFFPPLWSKIWC